MTLDLRLPISKWRSCQHPSNYNWETGVYSKSSDTSDLIPNIREVPENQKNMDTSY